MRDVVIQLIEGDPKNLVDRVIMDVTGKPYSHCRIYFEPWDMTLESTVWGGPFKSGIRTSCGELPCDVRLVFRDEITGDRVMAGFEKAIDLVNSRAWYNFALTFFDILLFPTRRFWGWLYRKTGWAPFWSASTNCSEFVDVIALAMGENLWPGMPPSLTVPGDYLSCKRLEIIK